MEDKEIVDLFWNRMEIAVQEVAKKYSGYCQYIANSILDNVEDSKECINDTWLKAWNSIPPNRPENLAAYLGKLTRTTAIDYRRKNNRKRRGGKEIELVIEELADTLPDQSSVDRAIEEKELSQQINKFLGTLSQFDRNVFVCRYWYLEPIQTIARNAESSESKIKSNLYRTRNKLKAYLETEGYYVGKQ